MTAGSTGYLYQRGPTGGLTGSTELSGRSVTWSFDGIYRLTDEAISGAPSKANGSVSYTLDPVGNRLSDTSSLSGVNSGSFSYNPDDELLSETYDANGNVTAANGNAYQYDSQNELVGMNGGAVRLVYSGDGNRVAKTVNGVTTRYLVDDLNPTGYAQVVEETVNGAPQRTYTYGLQRISKNQIVNNTWTPNSYRSDGKLSGLCVPLCGCLQPMAIPCVLTTYTCAANDRSVSLLYHNGFYLHQENPD